MSGSVFAELKFWLMLLVSVVLPFGIYGGLMTKRVIARTTVLVLGFSLVLIAGVDVYILQNLAAASKLTPSLADDAVFISEISLALYLLPAMFGGIGVNVISHILVSHLVKAERRFTDEDSDTQHHLRSKPHGPTAGRRRNPVPWRMPVCSSAPSRPAWTDAVTPYADMP